jgi:ATP-dependent helicase/nuclease subunit A
LAEVLAELDALLNAEKRAARALDFDDLQLTMLRALEENADLRDYYRRRFSTVFVDEFQDTNPLQVKIIEQIAEERAHCFVGDPKQSIFGWRFAEPETIREKQREFSERGYAGKLTYNWRSRPEILTFVNQLFSGEEEILGFEYDNLVPAGEKHKECTFREKDRPCIDVIVRPEAEGDFSLPADERRRLEAEAVVGYIHEAVDAQALMHTKAGESQRPLEYGDFAILLRKNAYVPAYEAALSAANIPFVSETSVGFLDTPEISALCDLLKLMLTPENDLLLAQVLRSDLVGLSASGLAELTIARNAQKEENDETAPLVKLLEKGVAFSDADDAIAVEEFMFWRCEILRDLPALSASALLHRIIDGLRLREKLTARDAPMRSLMNLNRFADMAHSVEGLGYAALGKLVEQVRELRYQASQIGEMWMEGAGFVRIMTVHRAKGLTIPAVILPGIDYQLDTSSPALSAEPSSDEPGRYELGIYHRLADGKSREPWHERHRELRKARVAQEETRLLYVALTRASEHIAIFGVSPNPRGGKPWAQLLSRLISDEETLAEGFADLISVRLTPAQPELEGATEETPTLGELALLVSAVTADADGSKVCASELMREVSVAPDTSGFHRYLYGVSEFLEFVRTGEIGKPSAVDDEITDYERIDGHKTVDEAGWEDARALGTAIHDLLAFAVAQPEAAHGSSVSALLNEEFINTHFPQHSEIISRQRSRTEELLRGYEALNLTGRCAGAKAVRPEYAFLLKAESVFLRGRIDLLLADDKALTVLDYKTDWTDSGKRKSGLLEHYRPQLLAYSLAAQAIYPDRELRAGLALLDCGEIVWLNNLYDGLVDIRERLSDFAGAVKAGGGA